VKKIAFPTDDGETISRHMGRAAYFLIAVLDDSGAVRFEQREKPHHSDEAEAGQHEHSESGMGPAMFAPIADCQVLISGGMGEPAFEHAQAQGLKVVLPAEKNIKAALEAYRNGNLESDLRRIHKH
jgi:predicted Fe-Mo cluster-binding NifX family protein